MADKTRIPAPKGLKLAGRALWKGVTSRYALRVDELILLESACRTRDLVADLDAAMAGEPLTVPGSLGQLREHPLLREGRQQRALLARHLAQLKLPDEAELSADSGNSRSTQARKAANARWSRRSS